MAPQLPETMPAVFATGGLPLDDPRALRDGEAPVPSPGPRDLLVEIRAVSVNPVDRKRRAVSPADGSAILGFDAAGVVVATGRGVTRFAVGDEVWYAGDVGRQGTNAAYHAVDERIVGRRPASLDWADAAALPLTALTAWETLFDRFRVDAAAEGTLLVVAGAGGVGSILTQLAKRLTRLTVVATAGRPESRDFAARMGADHVVGHADLVAEVRAVAPDGTDYIFTPYTEQHFASYVELAKPFSQITSIDGPRTLDLSGIPPKSLTLHWEWMFTRARSATPDMGRQGEALDRVAELVDAGELQTTATTRLEGLDAATLREAHRLIESEGVVGKVVISR
ncbi:zinc-binding alcohol dehydrogenase family protein [Homoserinibacter sp. YIM 151385]|uniref:zinc-binding alcohol dehydrogenase family protein n=1 Tax=Homoserinibacter sp. YIM 151385 TaxID=2985506 RepID=UPI0022EFF2B9|nr:zinc-binding alcohol dehydrogenase family protein [Homoserinibacter sp. YIM 151385]WBU37038.1 zinc-binding alcohol dehydrogenase family protein [Homoserinibacter sp. YIM 151385]